jgi:molybdopterin synthase catalytic subunit
LNASRNISPDQGAVVTFLGYVRDLESGKQIEGIEYEAFEAMALHQFTLILDKLADKWPVTSVRLVHRIGFVPVNEPSLWVEVIAPHRTEAFQACQYLIEEMKNVVPIWKRARIGPGIKG